MARKVAISPSNKALQTDKDKLSRLLHSQEPRQLAFAAELGRYVAVRRARGWAAFFALGFSLTACGFAEYEDVSSREENAGLIGNEYRTTEPLLIHGITRNLSPHPVIDYYLVTLKPGIGGPEVLSQHLLPTGTHVRISRVEMCTSWWCSHLRVIIDLPNTKYAGQTITVQDANILKMDGGRNVIKTTFLAPLKEPGAT